MKIKLYTCMKPTRSLYCLYQWPRSKRFCMPRSLLFLRSNCTGGLWFDGCVLKIGATPARKKYVKLGKTRHLETWIVVHGSLAFEPKPTSTRPTATTIAISRYQTITFLLLTLFFDQDPQKAYWQKVSHELEGPEGKKHPGVFCQVGFGPTWFQESYNTPRYRTPVRQSPVRQLWKESLLYSPLVKVTRGVYQFGVLKQP